MYNIPRVTDVSQELNHWVYNPKNHKKLMLTPSKDVPECVKIFTQYIYMCVYINPNLDRYGPPGGPDMSLTGTRGDGPNMFFSTVDSSNCAMSRPVPNFNEEHISSSADQPRGGRSFIIGL